MSIIKKLLNRCAELHSRRHYRTKKNIIEIFECDKQEFLQLPEFDFDVSTYRTRKVDKEGRVKFNNQRIYFLEPRYAKQKVQVKVTYNTVTFYNIDLEVIAEFDRLYGDKNYTAIQWEQWLSTVARKPNSLFHSALTDLFTEKLKSYLLEGTSKLRGIYMIALSDLSRTMSLDKALYLIDAAADMRLEEQDDIMLLAELI